MHFLPPLGTKNNAKFSIAFALKMFVVFFSLRQDDIFLYNPGDLNRYAQRRMGQCYFQLQTLIYLWASAERIYGFELIDFL